MDTSKIYWLGGSTCAGKTTISNIFSERYGMMVYHCDEYLAQHIEKSNAQEHPNLKRVTGMSWNDILNMSVEEYLQWAIGLFNEEFKMILEDLNKLSDDKPVLVEGVGLFPELIYNSIPDIDHAIWVVADEVFYRKHQMDRKGMMERVRECANPEKALENYINFDLAMGRYIIRDAKRLGLSVLEVRNDSDVIKNVDTISSYFNLA